MVLPTEFIQSIRKDIILILHVLRQKRKDYSLDNPEELSNDIYKVYHSHTKETTREGLMFVKEIMRSTMLALNSLGIFEKEFDRRNDGFVRFYSWNPQEDTDDVIIDSCTVRLYLNPRLEHFQEVIVDLMEFYERLKPNRKAPIMFKIPFLG